MTSLPTCTYLRTDQDGSVLLDLHVMPNAARTEIQGLHDGALRVRLHAPPQSTARPTWLCRAGSRSV